MKQIWLNFYLQNHGQVFPQKPFTFQKKDETSSDDVAATKKKDDSSKESESDNSEEKGVGCNEKRIVTAYLGWLNFPQNFTSACTKKFIVYRTQCPSQAGGPHRPTKRVVINELSAHPSVQPTLKEVVGKGKGPVEAFEVHVLSRP
ncbi:hypothetical protein Fot_19485 [Forsythia ovata]|uniref:Uncharacterized protein n=1 Tax=Forsythia ovata TaxID=205694 RepID=A0ABD1VL59_9LAMI